MLRGPAVKSRLKFWPGGRVVIVQLRRYERKREVVQEDGMEVETVTITKDERHVSFKDKLKGTELELVGIVVHFGNLPNSGHYKAYCKKGKIWREYNDENVREVTSKEVFRQQAYLLFYQTSEA
eukprot:Hpha_TRINITY_DN15078_c4_g2::TRINITY_DN15078_c4_g2_i1::g.123629::m.123629